MNLAVSYSVLYPGTTNVGSIGCCTGDNDSYEMAQNCFVGMPKEFKLVSDYVFGMQDSYQPVLELVSKRFMCNKIKDLVALALMELQRNKPWSERQCAVYLNITRYKYRKHYQTQYAEVFNLLAKWYSGAFSYAKHRSKN